MGLASLHRFAPRSFRDSKRTSKEPRFRDTVDDPALLNIYIYIHKYMYTYMYIHMYYYIYILEYQTSWAVCLWACRMSFISSIQGDAQLMGSYEFPGLGPSLRLGQVVCGVGLRLGEGLSSAGATDVSGVECCIQGARCQR